MTLLRNKSFVAAILLATIIGLTCMFAATSAFAQVGFTTSGQNVIQNPISSNITNVSQFVEAVLKGILAIGVPIAVFFIVLSGFRFITAQGNQEKLTAARSNFMYTIIGVAIFIGAWALAQLIAATLKQIGVNA